MKVMISWEMHPEKLHEILPVFAGMSPQEEEAMMGSNIKLLGRWHDLARGRGVAIYETDDATALSNYALNWNNAMDLDVAIVLDDEETRAIGKQRSA